MGWLDELLGPSKADKQYAQLRADSAQIRADISDLKGQIMATNEQTAADLRALNEQLLKVRAEQTGRFEEQKAKIQALQDALDNLPGGTSPEVDEAMAAVKGTVQGFDDEITDTPPDA
jgi:DNA repair exonuclease SbcCD ATPase subunit